MSRGNSRFDPDEFMNKWSPDLVPSHDNGSSFRQCIIKAFNLPEDDDYVYRAQGTTTLEITQKAINGKIAHGLHDWYHDENGTVNEPAHPTSPEISAYTSLFAPLVGLPKALNGFKNSAKSNSLQSQISNHLADEYMNTTQGLLPAKKDRTHKNPYLDLWRYSCEELEWAGPWPNTVHTKISHHILPVFYHHFGCVVPTYTALHTLARLSQPAKPSTQPVLPILDIGSGTGYWTYLLRIFPTASLSMKPLEVQAVDIGLSEYRVSWVTDTVIGDGVEFLRRGKIRVGMGGGGGDGGGVERPVDGGRGCVLLLVYPQATGSFTSSTLKAYKGDVIVIAGTQNGNGFTGFQDERVEAWMERERRDFEVVVRVPLPSFAGKDEGMTVWRRKGGM